MKGEGFLNFPWGSDRLMRHKLVPGDGVPLAGSVFTLLLPPHWHFVQCLLGNQGSQAVYQPPRSWPWTWSSPALSLLEWGQDRSLLGVCLLSFGNKFLGQFNQRRLSWVKLDNAFGWKILLQHWAGMASGPCRSLLLGVATFLAAFPS